MDVRSPVLKVRERKKFEYTKSLNGMKLLLDLFPTAVKPVKLTAKDYKNLRKQRKRNEQRRVLNARIRSMRVVAVPQVREGWLTIQQHDAEIRKRLEEKYSKTLLTNENK